MKSLFLTLAMFVSTNVFAATVELGKYKAVSKDDPGVVATFDLKDSGAAGKTANLDINASGTLIKCQGKWAVTGNDFKADVTCDHAAFSAASVVIDIRNVTAAGLRSPQGVDVPLKIPDLLGDEAVTFNLKKAD